MKTVVIYDSIAPRAYSQRSIATGNSGVGGAEASVARVAVELARDCRVVVGQGQRNGPTVEDDVTWTTLEDAKAAMPGADAVIVIRKPADAATLRWRNRRVPILVWYHDWYPEAAPGASAGEKLRRFISVNARAFLHSVGRLEMVCVSEAHLDNMRRYLGGALFGQWVLRRLQANFVYNPVSADGAGPAQPGEIDRDRLIYFSAAWKGLDQVLQNFRALRAAIPQVRLTVASPHYAEGTTAPAAEEGVERVVGLSRQAVLNEVARCLCVFYPAAVVPETFGLVFAESHLVGTPVLAHPFGAAPEILSPDEMVDAADQPAIIERIQAWRNGARPAVARNREFEIETIGRKWRSLLFDRPS